MITVNDIKAQEEKENNKKKQIDDIFKSASKLLLNDNEFMSVINKKLDKSVDMIVKSKLFSQDYNCNQGFLDSDQYGWFFRDTIPDVLKFYLTRTRYDVPKTKFDHRDVFRGYEVITDRIIRSSFKDAIDKVAVSSSKLNKDFLYKKSLFNRRLVYNLLDFNIDLWEKKLKEAGYESEFEHGVIYFRWK